MIEEHKTKVLSVVFDARFLLQLVEVLVDSLLHSCPVLSDIWEHEGLDWSTLHSHLTLTLHESFLDIVSDTFVSSLKE
jgi:hypothetical protein